MGNMFTEKNNRIRNKVREAKDKSSQTAKPFEIKSDKSKISKERITNLKRLFLGGKWIAPVAQW